MESLFKIAQVSLIGLFLLVSPSGDSLEGANGPQIPQGNLIAYENPISPSQLHAMTKPPTVDPTSLSPLAYTEDQWVMLNRRDRHLAGQQQVGQVDGINTGLLSDAGGLIETASASKLDDLSVNGVPQVGGGYQPPVEAYAVADESSGRIDWNQLILTAMQVPEPSTYLLFGGFLTVAACIKRYKRSSSKDLA